jgi:4-hydroxy-3-polyprenylbenzoate decarboxylase
MLSLSISNNNFSEKHLTLQKKNFLKNTMTQKDRNYPDLHDHIEELKRRNLLTVIDRPIDKDSELHPLVRWQFVGGIDEKERKAFLFTNIINAKGRKYDIPVLVGGLAANREIYSVGMGCPVEEIQAKWDKALENPIPPIRSRTLSAMR